jgi:hypothetical protein
MTSTTHTRSIHIEAPVQKVFDYVKDPQHQWEAYDLVDKSTILAKDVAPDAGKGSTWTWQGHLAFIPVHGTMTREDYVVNERIVDHSTTGVLWTYTFDPDDAGTTLTMEVEVSSKVPYVDKVEDKIAWKGDKDLETWLGNFKKAIEA